MQTASWLAPYMLFEVNDMSETQEIKETTEVIPSRGDIARQNFYDGYNCAQSLFMAFSDLTGYTREEAARLSAPFGAGMGRMREVCGAMSSVLMVLGILRGYADTGEDGKKAALYAEVQELFAAFSAKRGTFLCRELLGKTESGPDVPTPDARTAEYYANRPCAEIIADAANLLESYLQETREKDNF